VYGHPSIRVAGGAVAHLIGLTSEIAEILKEKGVEYQINVIFAGKVRVEGLLETVESVAENVKAYEIDMYRKINTLLYSLFPVLAVKGDGFSRLKEALRGSDLIISRGPHYLSIALGYWTALLLAKPKEALLIEEYFGNPYWSYVELDVAPVAEKLKAGLTSLPSVLTSLTFTCLFADKVFVISEGGARVLLKEAPAPLRKACAKKVVPLYPPLHKARVEAPKKEGPFTFCTSGSFYPHQGYKELIKLVHVINELFGGEERVRFLLMGAPIQAASIIKPLLEGYTNVEFGYIKNKYEVYASECDAFLALYDPFRVFEFYGAPAKLADFVLFNKPIIVWKEEEYLKTIEYLTERCDCLRVVGSFEELVEEAVKLVRKPVRCECVPRSKSRSREVLEELIDEALSRRPRGGSRNR